MGDGNRGLLVSGMLGEGAIHIITDFETSQEPIVKRRLNQAGRIHIMLLALVQGRREHKHHLLGQQQQPIRPRPDHQQH